MEFRIYLDFVSSNMMQRISDPNSTKAFLISFSSQKNFSTSKIFINLQWMNETNAEWRNEKVREERKTISTLRAENCVA